MTLSGYPCILQVTNPPMHSQLATPHEGVALLQVRMGLGHVSTSHTHAHAHILSCVKIIVTNCNEIVIYMYCDDSPLLYARLYHMHMSYMSLQASSATPTPDHQGGVDHPDSAGYVSAPPIPPPHHLHPPPSLFRECASPDHRLGDVPISSCSVGVEGVSVPCGRGRRGREKLGRRRVGRERGGEDGGERREGGRGLHLMYSLGRYVLQQSLHSAINGRRHSNTTLVPSAPCELCGCSIQIGRVSSNVCNEYLRGNGLTLL